MAINPLQQYFRQPKIFIKLPSNGVYNKPGVFTGDTTNVPIFGMTGMDEIIMKTPDALITGESTVKVIESCCPAIKDAWEITTLDLDIILSAIRIATYGNGISIKHKCEHCDTDNDYELDLTKLIDHFNHITYDNRVVLKDVVVKLRPLTYKEVTQFGLRHFQLQQQLTQVKLLEDEDEKSKKISALYVEFGGLQAEIYSASVESIEAGNTVVHERAFIDEWLKNTEKSTFEQLSKHIDNTKDLWQVPPQPTECGECHKENMIRVNLDHSYFFATA